MAEYTKPNEKTNQIYNYMYFVKNKIDSSWFTS